METHTHQGPRLHVGCPACILIKRYGQPSHMVVSPPAMIDPARPNRERTKALMQEIKTLFFPNYRGPWFTLKPRPNH